MEASRIGRRIRAFRKLKNIKQTDFSKELGISVSVFGQIERGERSASAEQLQHMATFFQIDVAELMGTVSSTGKEEES
ncbi:helix-turn-helix domain-containing protein [Paenisporosarcina cavernae]|uniref:XRE family transcriptional regulator n=1 Tax=Paenisporosarcina cavernae TaxID=2320858 RepID=A0A385YW19_9BACL|nr:helix-turn-helix transcriptional regulator [Paenisporosarcina cavernae]AYC30671.1 XRE family transcriptional regulator [Paenisporosarcina cavernae]